jgi:outer membrane protein TolC
VKNRFLPLASAAVVIALSGGGCAVYHPQPLTLESVDAALKPPTRDAVRVEAAKLRHPMLAPVTFRAQDDGLSPEQAAIFAVIANPKLRSARDARGLANAQVIQAGILPNPQLSPSLDLPVGNSVPGIRTAYGLNLNWDVTAIFSRGAKLEAARAHAASVDLSVAWQEWQAAEAAKLAVYQAASLHRQAALVREIEQGLAQSADMMREAVVRHDKTETDLAPAAAAVEQARSDRLLLEQQEAAARLALNQTLGLPPSAAVRLRANLRFPGVADAERLAGRDLLSGLEERRLDLVALRLGYDSQEAALRAAVRAQFPKVTLGVTRASDNGGLKSLGPNAVFDLPFFDRNQGNIALEKATRQQLLDDYTGRVFDARAETAKAASDLRFTARREEASRAGMAALDKLASGYETALAAGSVDALVVYGARQSLGAKRLEAEKLRADLAGLIIALELATGWPSLTSGAGK